MSQPIYHDFWSTLIETQPDIARLVDMSREPNLIAENVLPSPARHAANVRHEMTRIARHQDAIKAAMQNMRILSRKSTNGDPNHFLLGQTGNTNKPGKDDRRPPQLIWRTRAKRNGLRGGRWVKWDEWAKEFKAANLPDDWRQWYRAMSRTARTLNLIARANFSHLQLLEAYLTGLDDL